MTLHVQGLRGALVRLGVKSNRRSVVKSKALCKDSFEEDVMKIK